MRTDGVHTLLGISDSLLFFLDTKMHISYNTITCPGGGIGRRTGLKIRRETVRVRVPPWAPLNYDQNYSSYQTL